MKKQFRLITLLMSLSFAANAQTQSINDINIRDPFILLEGETYYMYASSTENGIGGVAVYESTDLQNWTEKKQVLTLPEENWSRGKIWAPEVHKYKGRYFLFATINDEHVWKEPRPDWPAYVCRGTQIFVSDSPLGPFVPTQNEKDRNLHKTVHQQTPVDYMALDGTLYEENGHPYLVFCHEWVQIEDGTVECVKLDKELATAKSKPLCLFKGSDNPICKPGQSSYITDGCFLYRTKSGKLLMIWASFGPDGYAELIAESESGKIKGPWIQQKEPLFKEDGGHAMIFTDKEGNLRLVLHAPNGPSGMERAKIFLLEDKGSTISIR